MKSLLALVTLALTALVFEERARQVAGDARSTYNDLVVQATGAKKTFVQKVEQQPLVSLLIAGAAAYTLASLMPSRH